MSLTVYGAPLSPFVRKLCLCLIEKGLDYELEVVMPFGQPDWFLGILPSQSGNLKVLNGGDVSVSAGGDIFGGVYFLGRGDGRLSAGGGLLAGADALADGATPTADQVADPAALLALIEGQWSVDAVDDLKVSHVYNPTIVPFRFTGVSGDANLSGNVGGTAAASGLNNQRAAVYYTYSDNAGVSMTSLQGSLSLAPNAQNFNKLHGLSAKPAMRWLDR